MAIKTKLSKIDTSNMALKKQNTWCQSQDISGLLLITVWPLELKAFFFNC